MYTDRINVLLVCVAMFCAVVLAIITLMVFFERTEVAKSSRGGRLSFFTLANPEGRLQMSGQQDFPVPKEIEVNDNNSDLSELTEYQHFRPGFDYFTLHFYDNHEVYEKYRRLVETNYCNVA